MQEATENLDTPTEIVEAPAEKMVPQSTVNSLVGDAKLKGHAKGLEEGRAQAFTQAPPVQPAQPSVEQPQPVQSGNPQDIQSAVQEALAGQARQQQQAEEERQRQAGIEHVHGTLRDQMSKITNPEVLETLNSWTPPSDISPYILTHAADISNGKGVEAMHALSQSPEKYEQYAGFVRMGNHASAKQYLNSIGNSLSETEQASKQNTTLPVPPTDEIKGSPNTGGASFSSGARRRY